MLLFSFLSGSIPAWIIAKREIVNVLKGEARKLYVDNVIWLGLDILKDADIEKTDSRRL
jgi:hypothetical protein